jgi:hypothetical protein
MRIVLQILVFIIMSPLYNLLCIVETVRSIMIFGWTGEWEWPRDIEDIL